MLDTSQFLSFPSTERLSLINRLVDSNYLFDMEVESNKCLIPIPWEIDDKLNIPYGKADIPFLKKLLFSSNSMLICKSLHALIERAYDRIKAMDILRLNVLSALNRLTRHTEPFIRQRCCVMVGVLSGQPTGKVSVVGDRVFTGNLLLLLEDKDVGVRFHCAAALVALARHRLGNEAMTTAGCADKLADRACVEPDERVLRSVLRAVGWLTAVDGGVATDQPTADDAMVERLTRDLRSPDYDTVLSCVARLSRLVVARPAVAEQLAGDLFTVSLLVEFAAAPALRRRALRPFSLQLLCAMASTRTALQRLRVAVAGTTVADLADGLEDDDPVVRRYVRRLTDAVDGSSR